MRDHSQHTISLEEEGSKFFRHQKTQEYMAALEYIIHNAVEPSRIIGFGSSRDCLSRKMCAVRNPLLGCSGNSTFM